MKIGPALKALLSLRQTYREYHILKGYVPDTIEDLKQKNTLLAEAREKLAHTQEHLDLLTIRMERTADDLSQRDGQLALVIEDRDQLRARIEELTRFAPPGHYYSPVPSREDIEKYIAKLDRTSDDFRAITLADDKQRELLESLKTYSSLIPFKETPVEGLLYYFDNTHYTHTDAAILFCMLHHLRPKRVIEIGSGFSTCVTLDANRLFLGSQIEITSIDPHPDRIRSLTQQLPDRLTLVENNLQETDIRMFDQLDAGDILFVDSTHVSKAGSDVNYLFFEILPRLKRGVVIHLHDIFHRFEYSARWLREGRAWNEAYLLHAFLQYNDEFRVLLFVNYMQKAHKAWFDEHMPDAFSKGGGCFWMQKV